MGLVSSRWRFPCLNGAFPVELPQKKQWELTCRVRVSQVRKNSPNIKFLGGIFLGHPGPRRRDIPDKNFMQLAFFCCFRQGVAGMSRDLGRDRPRFGKTLCKKFWADFSYPTQCTQFGHCWAYLDDSLITHLICSPPRTFAVWIFWGGGGAEGVLAFLFYLSFLFL